MLNDNVTVPKTLNEAKTILENKMVEVLAILEAKARKPMPFPTIEFKRLGLRRGFASQLGCRIVINSDTITEKFWDHTLNVTLPHEVCHHVAPLIYNPYVHGSDKNAGWSHGRAWQQCMVWIGLPPDRCVEANLEEHQTLAIRKVARKYAYKCGCKTHYLTAIKHNRFQAGQYNRLHCLKCKVTLTYLGEKIGE